MDCKYQIFISSTYIDLIKEREEVTKQILRNYHFPIGMEMFAASDKKQWEVIRKTIDSSDIYILLLGYRYGSIDADEGISFTEKEFNYAIQTNKPVFVFVKRDDRLLREIQNLLLSTKSKPKEENDRLQELFATKYDEDQTKVDLFRQKAMTGRVVNFFTSKSNIDIQSTIVEKIKELPLGGWVRQQNIHNYEPLVQALEFLGIKHIRVSKPTPRDDEEKIKLFRESNEIKILQYNGSRFFEIFKEGIADFLSKENSKLKILLADKESVFYEENSKMVGDHFSNLDANKNLVDYAESRLRHGLVEAEKINPAIRNEKDKLIIKHFNTQMRSPLIIFDNRVCHITLTYAPSESLQAFEMEMITLNNQQSFTNVCIKHFDRIWEMV